MFFEGQGVPQDYVEAHLWIELAASREFGDTGKRYTDMLDRVGERMTPQHLAEAQQRARERERESRRGLTRAKPMK